MDYLADYLENIRSRRVFPDVVPGYMRELVPVEAPQQGEPWENIFQDVERVIMPGVCSFNLDSVHSYYISNSLLDNSLAKSTHACLLSSIDIIPEYAW